MAKSDTNYQNFKKYYDNLAARGYDKLVPPNHEETLEELIAEGNRLLEAETKKPVEKTPQPCEKKRLQDTLAADSKNPYVRARNKILNDLPKERRERIEAMEQTGHTDNATYEEFTKMITKLGDKFSS